MRPESFAPELFPSFRGVFLRKRVRDSQRRKVYTAERRAHKRHDTPVFRSRKEIDHWVKKITKTQWWKKNGGVHGVEVRHTNRAWCCAAYGYYIRVSSWCWSGSKFGRWVVLHELAHCLNRKPPSHGRDFCRIYLECVRRWIGPEAKKILKEEFRKLKVKHTKYSKERAQQARERARAAGSPPWVKK